MYILGISCYYHDAAACLLKDGEVIAAAEEERFTRIKHDNSFPTQAIRFCLDFAHIKSDDLAFVVFNEKPFLKLERVLKTILSTYPNSLGVFQDAMVNWMADKLWIKSHIEEKVGVSPEKILFCEHHLSHAASSFFCSPFDESAILTCDGVGEWATTTLGRAKAKWRTDGKNEIELFSELRFPHSLGLLYSAFTAFLGFEVNEGEYKVMGMAAFGAPKHTEKIYKILRVHDDASFWLDMRYLSYPYHNRRSFTKKFEELFGRPRDPKARFVTKKTSLYDDPNEPSQKELAENQYYADIAASIQKVTEDTLIKIANYLCEKTRLKKLCLAGGVALNCLANSRLLNETPFQEIFIQPAAGDSGAAMGAALFVYHSLLENPRKFVLKTASLGKEFSETEVTAFIKNNRLKHQHFKEENDLLSFVADALTKGKVIGWFEGRAEWGPRALGNRSILADPRDKKMKDIVNIKIKIREPFRPFAPSILCEKAEDFFKLDKLKGQIPLRFMLFTAPAKNEEAIPAATHIDSTSRIQTVDKETNPRYYRLIDRFYQKTGVPAVLNTSFNLKGEPIVNSPEDALRTFMNSGMDMLVLGDFILEKDGL
jgi:carbamoyltransferase